MGKPSWPIFWTIIIIASSSFPHTYPCYSRWWANLGSQGIFVLNAGAEADLLEAAVWGGQVLSGRGGLVRVEMLSSGTQGSYSTVHWAGAWLSCDGLPGFSLPWLGLQVARVWEPFLSAPDLLSWVWLLPPCPITIRNSCKNFGIYLTRTYTRAPLLYTIHVKTLAYIWHAHTRVPHYYTQFM